MIRSFSLPTTIGGKRRVCYWPKRSTSLPAWLSPGAENSSSIAGRPPEPHRVQGGRWSDSMRLDQLRHVVAPSARRRAGPPQCPVVVPACTEGLTTAATPDSQARRSSACCARLAREREKAGRQRTNVASSWRDRSLSVSVSPARSSHWAILLATQDTLRSRTDGLSFAPASRQQAADSETMEQALQLPRLHLPTFAVQPKFLDPIDPPTVPFPPPTWYGCAIPPCYPLVAAERKS